jgi:hypothetical protein
MRLLSCFAIAPLRAQVLQTELVSLFEQAENNLDCVLALAVLAGDDSSLVAQWFGEDARVLLVCSVLEDCTVTSDWGYELGRPLEVRS